MQLRALFFWLSQGGVVVGKSGFANRSCRGQRRVRLILHGTGPPTPSGYPELLQELKTRIRNAQVRAALAVNRELVLLYWSIGREILDRQGAEGWGTKVIERLAHDLQVEFPGIVGFSPRSLKYMRSFASAWREAAIVQQLAAQLPWGHHMVLLDRAKEEATRLWYLRASVEYGWSRNILVHMIKRHMHLREGKAISNFSRTLPPEGSDMAEQILRDPLQLRLSDPLGFPFMSESSNEAFSSTSGICCSSSAGDLRSSAARCR